MFLLLPLDCTRHFDARAGETEDQHQSRIFQQKVRQRELRAKETSEQQKLRKAGDTEKKVSKCNDAKYKKAQNRPSYFLPLRSCNLRNTFQNTM